MATYSLKELIRGWQTETFTADQMIGQLLFHIGELNERIGTLERDRWGLDLLDEEDDTTEEE